jgi:hypothetical protein
MFPPICQFDQPIRRQLAILILILVVIFARRRRAKITTKVRIAGRQRFRLTWLSVDVQLDHNHPITILERGRSKKRKSCAQATQFATIVCLLLDRN